MGFLSQFTTLFVDDNVVYDSAYFGRSGEIQNDIHTELNKTLNISNLLYYLNKLEMKMGLIMN